MKLKILILLAAAALLLTACSLLPANDLREPSFSDSSANESASSSNAETSETNAASVSGTAPLSTAGTSKTKAASANKTVSTSTTATSQTKATSARKPAPPGEISLTISAAGDCTLGIDPRFVSSWNFNEVYKKVKDDAYFFKNVLPIFEADDMTLVNLEGVLSTSKNKIEKAFNFKGPPSYVNILLKGSVEAVSMGNNHNRDYGEESLLETADVVSKAGLAYAYDDVIGIYEAKGIKIGMVSVNEHYDGKKVETFLKKGIQELKDKGAGLIIAACHWGVESSYTPNAYQRKLGRMVIDWGADLVIGHHPHVLQGIDKYKGKYIAYSLGNFCYGGHMNPKDKDTMIFQQTFHFKDGVLLPDQDDINIIPCSLSSVTNRNNYQPTPASGKEKTRIMKKINSFSEYK